MMKTRIYILLFSFTVSLSFSQENKDTKESIENQFEEIYKKSNSYQAYKIIKKRYYQDLKQNTLDSLERSKKIISDKDRLLFTQKNKLKKDSILLSKTTLELKD